MPEENQTKIRSFIALDLSDEAQEELARIIKELKRSDANVKWVRPESIHLTFKFLGYIREEQIDPISKRIEKIAGEASPFDINLDRIGVFPGWKRPRVIWVGTAGYTDKMKSLAKRIEDEMAEEGFEKEERDFKAHLTVGRVRSLKGKERLEKEAHSVEVKPAKSHISKIILYESKLTPEGAVYTPLASYDLIG